MHFKLFAAYIRGLIVFYPFVFIEKAPVCCGKLPRQQRNNNDVTDIKILCLQ